MKLKKKCTYFVHFMKISRNLKDNFIHRAKNNTTDEQGQSLDEEKEYNYHFEDLLFHSRFL